MPENMPVENTMAMASPQTPMFEIHRAEPEEFYQEPSDSYVQPTAEQDVPELSECYSEPGAGRNICGSTAGAGAGV